MYEALFGCHGILIFGYKSNQRINGPVNAHLRSEMHVFFLIQFYVPFKIISAHMRRERNMFDYNGHIHVYSPRAGSE